MPAFSRKDQNLARHPMQRRAYPISRRRPRSCPHDADRRDDRYGDLRLEGTRTSLIGIGRKMLAISRLG